MREIALEQAGLGTVLRNNSLFVPPNQREYAWTEEEVMQLFHDFARAINDGHDYFLGTLVTIPRNGALEVADGQQRLATTSLLLAAIRDYLKDRNEQVIVDSINGFLSGPDRESRAYIPKLRLNTDDNDLFRAIVSADASPLPPVTLASHKKLVDAYAEAKKYVRSLVAIIDEKGHGDTLNRWVTFIENNAVAILLRVPDDANAYKMFETLNDRGLRTSQADLVKNYLFSRADTRLNEVQHRWSYMRGALETLDDDDNTINFLRLALILKRGYLSAAQVYDAVQDEAKSEQAAVNFAMHLEALAPIYVSTFNPEHERWSDHPKTVRSAIEVFNLLDIKPMRSLLLAVAARMDQKQTTETMRFLVALGVRLLIAATVRSGSVETPLAATAREVFEGRITTAQQVKEALKGITPSDAQFHEAFERSRSSTAKLVRYYLRSIERTAKGEPEAEFIPEEDRNVITLEHVLPERPEGNWPTFTDEDVSQYAKRLGNLALLKSGANSNLKSATFDEKKKVYAESSYELTNQIATLAEWTTNAIIERQKVLADLAIKTWTTS